MWLVLAIQKSLKTLLLEAQKQNSRDVVDHNGICALSTNTTPTTILGWADQWPKVRSTSRLGIDGEPHVHVEAAVARAIPVHRQRRRVFEEGRRVFLVQRYLDIAHGASVAGRIGERAQDDLVRAVAIEHFPKPLHLRKSPPFRNCMLRLGPMS